MRPAGEPTPIRPLSTRQPSRSAVRQQRQRLASLRLTTGMHVAAWERAGRRQEWPRTFDTGIGAGGAPPSLAVVGGHDGPS